MKRRSTTSSAARPRAVARRASRARAWEPETTHAGLAEQAALASRLHQAARHARLHRRPVRAADDPARRCAGADRRRCSCCRRRTARCPTRAVARRRSAGSPPAPRSPMFPAAHGANHFYDPRTRRGWHGAGSQRARRRCPTRSARRSAARRCPSAACPRPTGSREGQPVQPRGFPDQYAKAVTAATPGERSRHMAAALVAAGAIIARARRSRRTVARARRLRRAPRAARRRARRSRLAVRADRGARVRPARRAAAVARRSRARTCATTSPSPTAAASPT